MSSTETVSAVDFSFRMPYKLYMALSQGPFYLSLGSRLRAARKKKLLTQEHLSAAVGLTRTSITNIEKGRQPLPVHLLIKLARILDVEVQSLIPPYSLLEADIGIRIEAYSEDQQQWINRIVRDPKAKGD